MKLVILAFLLLFSLHAFGNMRNCTLLPVTDNLNGALSYSTFKSIETYLKRNKWCRYHSNADFIGIFARYQEKLPEYLKDPSVLSTVSRKLNAGSMIRLHLNKKVEGIDVELKVFGANGKDILFRQRGVVTKDDLELVAKRIETWLNIYEKKIPYDALVTGVLGDQVTIDVGKDVNVGVGQKVTVVRLTKKNVHPLLNTVVGFQTETLAEGKVFSLGDHQALSVLKRYFGPKKIEKGDWIRLEQDFKVTPAQNLEDKENDEDRFGRLGFARLSFDITQSTLATSVLGANKKWAGRLMGLTLNLTGQITREYLAILDVTRRFGDLSGDSGTLVTNTPTLTQTFVKIGGGYRFLPLGFFYGPRVDVFAGYALMQYSANVSASDGLGDTEFSGILIGLNVDVPVVKSVRANLRADVMGRTEFKSDNIPGVGGTSKASSLALELGANYTYSPRITIDGGLQLLNSKASTGGSVNQVTYRDTVIRLGATFGF